MSLSRGSGNPQHDLNHSSPAASTVHLGDWLADLTTAVNFLLLAQSGGSLVGVTVPKQLPNRLTTAVKSAQGDAP
jgi:hypothetical protein